MPSVVLIARKSSSTCHRSRYKAFSSAFGVSVEHNSVVTSILPPVANSRTVNWSGACTQGTSYNSVLGGYGGYVTDYGFRIASANDVDELFASAGIIPVNGTTLNLPPSSEKNVQAAYELTKKVGRTYEEQTFNTVLNQLVTVYGQRWNRMMLLCYLSLYIGMWWAYFRSKKYPEGTASEANSLKIRSLRRLLGTTSKQWQPHAKSTSDDQKAIDAYRRKSETSMQVIAVLIAVSILIFDQISNIWMTEEEFSVWQYGILWIGMLAAVISFICFMMCVDALDTVFNQFRSDPIRNVLVKYFYDYTLNPRYAGGAAMLFSVILLLGFHSEVLASLAVIAILLVGYNLWFPNVSIPLKDLSGYTQTVSRKSYLWYVTLLLLPLAVRMVVFILHA